MKGCQLVATATLALVVGLAATVLLKQTDRPAEPGSDPQGLDAVAHVRGAFLAGDAVRVVPAWNEDLWSRLQAMGPGTDSFPYAALLRGDRVDPVTLLNFKRVWVVGTEGRSPRPPEDVFQALVPLDQADFPDGTQVALFEMPSMDWRGSLTDSWSKAKVFRRDNAGKERPCPHRAGQFRCGKEGWGNPHITTRDVFHNEVSWVLAHPPANGETLVIRWQPPTARTLIVRCGFTLKGIRKENGSATTVRIRVDGQTLDTFEMAPHRYHLELRVLQLPPDFRGPIEVEVHAEDHRLRQLMLELDVVNHVPDALRNAATHAP